MVRRGGRGGQLLFAEDVAHAADLGADAAEFFFKALVSSVEVVDAVEDGFAVGDEGGEDEGGGGAEVRAHDGGGLEVGSSADGGGAAVDGDVGAHAVEFLDVHEAIFKDVFGDGGGAFGLGGEGHELGLHVGGEAGVLLGGDVGGLEGSAGADADTLCADVEADAALVEFSEQRSEVSGVAAVDVEVAAGDGAGHEEGAGLDAVRVDAVAGAVEFGDAVDLDGRRAGAFDVGAHGGEERGQVGDFGLAGAVFKDGFAVGEDGGHQEVFGAGDGDLVEDDVGSAEGPLAVCGAAGFEVAVLLRDGGAHGFEAFDVEVDGSAADGASAGHGDAGDAGAGDQGAEDERGGAHGLDDLVLGDGVGEDGAADVGAVLGAAVAEFDLGAHGGEQFALGLDVLDLRNVFEDDFVFGEDGGGHAGERGVLCAGDFDGSEEGIAPADDELVHGVSLRMGSVEMGAGGGSWLGVGETGAWRPKVGSAGVYGRVTWVVPWAAFAMITSHNPTYHYTNFQV